jgi:hypothetical protein
MRVGILISDLAIIWSYLIHLIERTDWNTEAVVDYMSLFEDGERVNYRRAWRNIIRRYFQATSLSYVCCV